MRFNVSASQRFFDHPQYPEFELLLAAAGAVVVKEASGGKIDAFDFQINPVLMGGEIGQYALTGVYLDRIGSSAVTIEIDHIDDVTPDVADDKLICQMAVTLVHHLFREKPGLMHMPNCWSKQHGSTKDQTGWFDGIPTEMQRSAVAYSLTQFVNREISSEHALMRIREEFAD